MEIYVLSLFLKVELRCPVCTNELAVGYNNSWGSVFGGITMEAISIWMNPSLQSQGRELFLSAACCQRSPTLLCLSSEWNFDTTQPIWLFVVTHWCLKSATLDKCHEWMPGLLLIVSPEASWSFSPCWELDVRPYLWRRTVEEYMVTRGLRDNSVKKDTGPVRPR